MLTGTRFFPPYCQTIIHSVLCHMKGGTRADGVSGEPDQAAEQRLRVRSQSYAAKAWADHRSGGDFAIGDAIPFARGESESEGHRNGVAAQESHGDRHLEPPGGQGADPSGKRSPGRAAQADPAYGEGVGGSRGSGAGLPAMGTTAADRDRPPRTRAIAGASGPGAGKYPGDEGGRR